MLILESQLLLSQARRGQILEHAEQSEEALDIWQHTLEEAKMIVHECREQLKAETDRLSVMEKAMGGSNDLEAATVTRTGPHRQRLRAAIEIEHMCTFFVANAYYQIKTDEKRTEPNSGDYHELERREESGYERAKYLRKELLHETHNKAETHMCRVAERVKSKALVNIPRISSFKSQGGIESRNVFERLDNLIAVMQHQARHIDDWRDKTIELLLLTLVDEEEADLRGDEYETSTKQQDEVFFREFNPHHACLY